MGVNLKEVRDRMASVQNTQQITKAMKMVSAAKLRKAQDAITELRPYANKLEEILSNLADNVDSESLSSLTAQREVKSVLLVVITSSKGLCGAFNANVIKAAREKLDGEYADAVKAGGVKLVFIGKKGREYFKNKYPTVQKVDDFVDLIEKPSFDAAASLSNIMIQRFQEEVYDRIDIAFSEFRNAAMQNFIVYPYLPINQSERLTEISAGSDGGKEKESSSNADYIFEPDQDQLLLQLIPSILRTQIFRFLLDTSASEHGARMTAMDKATDNASDLLKELRINYNKARQEAITRELSEIVGGAAALEG
jgi:F-type H+-transporting ATPase subunit gamma